MLEARTHLEHRTALIELARQYFQPHVAMLIAARLQKDARAVRRRRAQLQAMRYN